MGIYQDIRGDHFENSTAQCDFYLDMHVEPIISELIRSGFPYQL